MIELAYWSGLSQSEVASYLGIPLGTAKSRLHRSLGAMRSTIEEAPDRAVQVRGGQPA